MTGAALGFLMFSEQGEVGFCMVEGDLVPARLRVTGLALRPEAALMRLLRFMAGEAI